MVIMVHTVDGAGAGESGEVDCDADDAKKRTAVVSTRNVESRCCISIGRRRPGKKTSGLRAVEASSGISPSRVRCFGPGVDG